MDYFDFDVARLADTILEGERDTPEFLRPVSASAGFTGGTLRQGNNAIAVGRNAGVNYQIGNNAIAIGRNADVNYQIGNNAIAIGGNSVAFSQRAFSLPPPSFETRPSSSETTPPEGGSNETVVPYNPIDVYETYPRIYIPPIIMPPLPPPYNDSETVDKFNHIFNRYKIENILSSKKDSTEITNEEIDFLQQFMNIKKKITILKIDYKDISETNQKIENYIQKLEEMKKTLRETQNKYDDLVNNIIPQYHPDSLLKSNEKENEQISKIQEIMDQKNTILKENTNKLIDISENMNLLRQMISIEELLSEKEKKENNHPSCNICYENPIQYCLNPCGHTFCNSCTMQIKDKCHICRGEARNRIKLFY